MEEMSLNNEKFYYIVYGLKIESEIQLPELLEVKEGTGEVFISIGVLPKEVTNSIANGYKYSFEKKVMWFHIDKIATYYVYDGKHIIVQPITDMGVYDLKAYLLGTALGMILIQRNIIAIHGGTVLINDKAVTIVGDTGAGKSTLTSGLRLKGYPFMADDISTISYERNVNPGYPQQKLCKDTMIKLGYEISNYKMIDDDREKYVIPIKRGFVSKPIQLGAICEVALGNDDDVKIQEIMGKDKLVSLMNNVYRIEILKSVGISPNYFSKCLEIVKSIPFYRISRPKDKFTVNQQISAIEDTLR
jgi:hypothetical protein